MKIVTAVAIALALLLIVFLLLQNGDEGLGKPAETGAYIAPTVVAKPTGGSAAYQDGRTIKTVQFYEGQLPRTEPARFYRYELPMIDLGGSQAVGCNQEIERRYGALIRQSVAAIEQYELPVLEKLTYSSFQQAGILTLRVDRLDTDGASASVYYTVAAETGGPVSVEELFAAAGLTGTPLEVLEEAVTSLFTRYYGPMNESNSAYTTALFCTQNALESLTATRMHLTERGTLLVAVELYDPAGGSGYVELELPGSEGS